MPPNEEPCAVLRDRFRQPPETRQSGKAVPSKRRHRQNYQSPFLLSGNKFARNIDRVAEHQRWAAYLIWDK